MDYLGLLCEKLQVLNLGAAGSADRQAGRCGAGARFSEKEIGKAEIGSRRGKAGILDRGGCSGRKARGRAGSGIFGALAKTRSRKRHPSRDQRKGPGAIITRAGCQVEPRSQQIGSRGKVRIWSRAAAGRKGRVWSWCRGGEEGTSGGFGRQWVLGGDFGRWCYSGEVAGAGSG